MSSYNYLCGLADEDMTQLRRQQCSFSSEIQSFLGYPTPAQERQTDSGCLQQPRLLTDPLASVFSTHFE